MPHAAIDIIIPVWNRPMETRSCLVSLIQHTPDARFILVDNGSDRETENLLEEFAERLDERALLLRTERNQGYIKAVNKGLARAEAPFLVIVRPTSIVTAGWLDPLIDFAFANANAGIIVPRLLERGGRNADAVPASGAVEVNSGSLAAMLIKKELYERIGGLGEELDGDYWCLMDYSRQAYREGYLTVAVAGGIVTYSNEQPLGSTMRREELVARSRQRFNSSWGETAAYCLYLPKGTDSALLQYQLQVVLQGARLGYQFTIIGPAALCRQLVNNNIIPAHNLITVQPLSLFGGESAVRKTVERLRGATAGIIPVIGGYGMTFPGESAALSFAELEKRVCMAAVEKQGVTVAVTNR